ncbi:MAG: hypothetical protein WCW36_01100 [Candidatus Paceibacterota bacterium]
MATTGDVQKLAALARIKIDDADLAKFTSEFDSILAYVGQLEALEIPTDASEWKPALRNVMRPDGEPHAAGAYTEKLVAQFPSSENNALVVKQIITHE